MAFKRHDMWHSDFRALDPRTGRPRRWRLSLGPEVRTSREADAAERRLRVEIEGGRVPASAPPATGQKPAPAGRSPSASSPSAPPSSGLPSAPFSGLAARWLEVSVHGKLKPKTYQLYESLCRVWLVPYFGHREASTITAADIEALQAHMRATPRAKGGSAPLSPKTINEALGCLSSMFNTAKRWKYLRENPCDQVERMSVPPVDFAFYDAEQTARWLATCQELEPDWYALFFVAFRTGMREGELFALEVPDLDLQREFVRVQRTYGPAAARDEETGLAVRAYFEHSAKNNRIRTIGLTAGTLGVLRVHVRRRRAGLVWSTRTRPDGDPHLTRSIVEAPFSRVTAAAKLPPIGLHGMRHSFASQLAMADVPLAKIQQLLGHASIKMTERYAHLAPGHASSAVNVLDTLVGTAPASGPNNAGRTPGSVVGVTGFEPVPAVLDFDPSKRRKRA